MEAVGGARAGSEQGDIVCVDLDGTLIAGDLLWESFATLAKERPLLALKSLVSLRKGRAFFKQYIARSVPLDPSGLPFRQDLLDDLQERHRRGATLVLTTASDRRYASAVAEHLGIFSDVVASDGQNNMSGQRKAAELVERYGTKGFEYVGNDFTDLPVWQMAGAATAVAVSPRLARYLSHAPFPCRVWSTRRSWWRAVGGAMRPHQWAKNVLVFVPIVGAHTILDVERLASSGLAFLAFSLAASAIYLVNDVADVAADRQHPRKRTRPLAAGDLSIPHAVSAAGVLAAASAWTALLSGSGMLMLVLAIYALVNGAYFLLLKRQPVFDVFTLTGLYVLRIFAGGEVTGTPLSSWLLAFALFFFLSLAFLKRYVELMTTVGSMPGRGYNSGDAQWMYSVGTSAGYMAAVVIALYISAPEVTVLYSRPRVLWLLCPTVLLWLTRLWFRAGRQLVHDDPVQDALRDRVSYLVAVLVGAIMIAAT